MQRLKEKIKLWMLKRNLWKNKRIQVRTIRSQLKIKRKQQLKNKIL